MSAARLCGVNLACNEQHGRHVIATKDLTPGTVVLCEQPYAHAILAGVPCCDCCLSTGASQGAPHGAPLKRCGGCKGVFYLNQEHQRRAWPTHKRECEQLRKLGRALPPSLLLAARVLWRAASNKQKEQVHIEGPTGPVLGPAWDTLQDHWNDWPPERKVEFAQMAVLVSKLFEDVPEDVRPTVKEITMLLARITCNSHTICDEELNPLAVGLYPTAAMVNHSCTPNCVQTFPAGSNGRIEFRTITHVPAGQQLTIAYAELAVPRWERRQTLLEGYCFDIDQVANTALATEASTSTPAQASSSEPAMPQNHTTVVVARTRAVKRPAWAEDLPAEVLCYVANEPPWLHDAADVPITAVVSRETGALEGGIWVDTTHSTTAAVERPQPATAASGSSDVVCSDRDEGDALLSLYPQPSGRGGPLNPQMPSDVLSARLSAASLQDGGGVQQAADRQKDVAVHCWGPLVAGGSHTPARELVQSIITCTQLQREATSSTKLQQSAGSSPSSMLQRALRIADGYRDGTSRGQLCVGPYHTLRMRICEDLFKALLDEANWLEATQLAEQLADIYAAVYPKVWPVRGLHDLARAKLQLLLQQLQFCCASKAKNLAATALSVLCITHGGGASCTKQAEETLYEAGMEAQQAG